MHKIFPVRLIQITAIESAETVGAVEVQQFRIVRAFQIDELSAEVKEYALHFVASQRKQFVAGNQAVEAAAVIFPSWAIRGVDRICSRILLSYTANLSTRFRIVAESVDVSMVRGLLARVK